MPSPYDQADGLSRTVQENLAALLEHRARMERQLTFHERVAAFLTARIGTMTFAYVHAVIVAVWLLWNTVLPLPKFDPYPFVMLAMCASVEAIFLSTFVLVSQQRMAEIEDRRAELDVQIGLVSEREITRVLSIVTAIAERLEVRGTPSDAHDLARDLHPDEILEQIDAVRENRPEETPPEGAPRRSS